MSEQATRESIRQWKKHAWECGSCKFLVRGDFAACPYCAGIPERDQKLARLREERASLEAALATAIRERDAAVDENQRLLTLLDRTVARESDATRTIRQSILDMWCGCATTPAHDWHEAESASRLDAYAASLTAEKDATIKRLRELLSDVAIFIEQKQPTCGLAGNIRAALADEGIERQP